jgi:allene oxide cyclase
MEDGMKKLSLAILVALVCTPTFAAEQLTVVERAKSDATAHVGPGADNRGDVLTWTNDIFDAADKVKVGTDQGFCIRVAVGKAYECSWTNTLAGGQIMVEGPFYDAGDSVLAITGGTGKYADARGQVTLHAHNAKGTEYDFRFVLTH